MEPILDYLKRRLKESGPASWPAIAAAVSAKLPPEKSVTEHSLRKLAYGDRENPGLQYAQALLDHFGLPGADATAGTTRTPASIAEAGEAVR